MNMIVCCRAPFKVRDGKDAAELLQRIGYKNITPDMFSSDFHMFMNGPRVTSWNIRTDSDRYAQEIIESWYF